jgi:hypothetical protein
VVEGTGFKGGLIAARRPLAVGTGGVALTVGAGASTTGASELAGSGPLPLGAGSLRTTTTGAGGSGASAALRGGRRRSSPKAKLSSATTIKVPANAT